LGDRTVLLSILYVKMVRLRVLVELVFARFPSVRWLGLCVLAGISELCFQGDETDGNALLNRHA
jgi:hypothetical protein